MAVPTVKPLQAAPSLRVIAPPAAPATNRSEVVTLGRSTVSVAPATLRTLYAPLFNALPVIVKCEPVVTPLQLPVPRVIVSLVVPAVKVMPTVSATAATDSWRAAA